MVSAQQEANSLFLKSDTDRKMTPSECPVQITVVYPQMASAEVHLLNLNAHLFEEIIKLGSLSKMLLGG